MDNNYLQHYGILGMRWGVRRSKQSSGSSNGFRKKKVKTDGWSDDAKTAYEIKKKKVKQMSNAELRKLNERTLLEKQYKDLNKHQKTAGQKFVNDILVGAAKDTAKNYVSKYMKKGLDYAMSK
ncbi:MAG: hypothetical protein ACI4V7_09185 [Succinivibrionaceae bacterium]